MDAIGIHTGSSWTRDRITHINIYSRFWRMTARTRGAHWRISANPIVLANPAFSWAFFLRARKGRPERARLITGAVRDDNICRFRFSSSLFPISKSDRTRCPVKLLDYVTRIGEKRSQVAVCAWRIRESIV